MQGLPFPELSPFSLRLSLLGVCCHLVAPGRMHPVDWGSIFAIIWNEHLLSASWCRAPPGHWDTEMNEAQVLPSRASQIREGGIINMVSANPSCPWASHLNHLFPLQSQSQTVLVRKLNYSFKNLAQMVSLSLSKALHGSLSPAE